MKYEFNTEYHDRTYDIVEKRIVIDFEDLDIKIQIYDVKSNGEKYITTDESIDVKIFEKIVQIYNTDKILNAR